VLKLIDKYIIKKYLGAFSLAIVLLISVSVVFDFAEKIDNFSEHHAPFKAVVMEYYMNFIPFFANLFTPLLAFIAVIFFTSKMAYNTEIIAILASGVSFRRLLVPYFISAILIGMMSFALSGYVIPSSNKVRLDFEDKYIEKFKSTMALNIQLEIEPGIIAYIERYEENRDRGYRFSLEKFHGKTLVSRLTAQYIVRDSANHWHLDDYMQRDFDGMHEKLIRGERLDTVINIDPRDFFISGEEAPQMTIPQLSQYLKRQKERGIAGSQKFANEYYKRFSMPFAALILTLMGVSISSRKVRGGTGLHLGAGIALSAIYILFTTVTSTFSETGSMPPIIAIWLPNIVFTAIGILLYFKAPK
jgi:lipopolysaccharide export system permease protein